MDRGWQQARRRHAGFCVADVQQSEMAAVSAPAVAASGCEEEIKRDAMLILALDLATMTGWAYGALGDDVPTFGSLRFGSPSCSHQALFGSALRWLSELLKAQPVDLVVYEEPLH